jgi:thiamine-phosphate pyrophosphorylase
LNQQGGAFNYCFISPLFDSLSKPGYKGHTSLQSEVKDVPFPVYALGGITIHTVTALKGGGFKGVAAIGAIWQNNPLEQYLRLKEACHGL